MAWLIDPAEKRFGPVLPYAAGVLFVIWAVYLGFITASSTDSTFADSTADVLVASAARDGTSPYQDLRILSETYRIAYVAPIETAADSPLVHPRTPASLLFLQLFAQMDADSAHAAAMAITFVSIGGLAVCVVPRLTSWPTWVSIGLMALLLFSGPVLRGLQIGSISAFIALLIGVFWVGTADRDSVASGLALGVAIALRLFPALLLVPALLWGRRRAAGSALAAAIGLNLVGMFVFGLSLTDVVDGLAATSATWILEDSNGSLIKPLVGWIGMPTTVGVVTVSTVLVLLVAKSRSVEGRYLNAVALTTVVMLLASPLSWEHYDVMLVPVAFVLMQGGPSVGRWAAWSWLSLITVGYYVKQPLELAGSLDPGLVALVGRMILLVGMIAVSVRAAAAERQSIRPIL